MTTTNVIKTTLPPRSSSINWEDMARSYRGALRTLKADFEIALEQPLSVEELREELRTTIEFIRVIGAT